jgi:hypothetical protein
MYKEKALEGSGIGTGIQEHVVIQKVFLIIIPFQRSYFRSGHGLHDIQSNQKF